MIINADAPKLEEREEKVRKAVGKTLRKVTVKIGLERIDTQEGVTKWMRVISMLVVDLKFSSPFSG